MKKVLPIALSGILALGGLYGSRAVADPPVVPPVVERDTSSFPLDLGTYEYALRASVLGAGTVDGAVVSVGVHEYDGPVARHDSCSSVDEYVSDVAFHGGRLYDLSLSFRVNNSIVGKAASLVLDDSHIESVVRLSDDGRLVPVSCVMSVGRDGNVNRSEMMYDEDASIVRIKRNGRNFVVDIPQEYFSSLVTPPSLVVKIINTPVHRDGERLSLGRFVDPETGRLENIESVVSRVSRGDVSAECIQGYSGSSLLMGSTVTPASVFGGVSARVGVFYTQDDGRGSFSAPMRGCLSFEMLNGGIIGSLADLTSSAYTSFVRYSRDER